MLALAIRKNYLLVLSFFGYLLTLGLLLSECDRQYYQVEKQNIVKYNFRALFPHDTRMLQELSAAILEAHGVSKAVDPDLEAQWRELAKQLVQGEGCVFRIRIVPKDSPQILEQRDDEKFKALNGFANTLFYRNFQNVVSYEVADSAGNPWMGLLSLHYTTPRDYPPVRALTERYRLFALLVFALVTGCFLFVVYHMILPTRRVVSRIDAASSSAPTIVSRPSSVLEKAYNDLARDAILMRVGQSIRNTSAQKPAFDRADLLTGLPEVLVGLLGYDAVLVANLSANESGAYTFASGGQAGERKCLNALCDFCRESLLLPDQDLAGARGVDMGACLVCDVTQDEQRPHKTLLVVSLPRRAQKADAGTRLWHLDTVAQLGDQVREQLAALQAHRQYVQRERGRANINLARNLGHDLTNIIATTRLDIRTILKLVEQSQACAVELTDHDRMLADAVTGLGNNTRLLQEVVNIYRSFSYLERPRFERVQLNDVVDEIVELFSLTLSKKTKLERAYADDLPECTVEPRLIKLAVFNVLTNATDALKLSSGPDGDAGLVVVATGLDATTGDVWIEMRDNGPGIRNSAGERADQAEIDGIFRYGVSTKTESGGEGLGLSWVWAIIADFHRGRIQARNPPDGGAAFCLFLGVSAEEAKKETNHA